MVCLHVVLQSLHCSLQFMLAFPMQIEVWQCVLRTCTAASFVTRRVVLFHFCVNIFVGRRASVVKLEVKLTVSLIIL